MDTPFTPDQLTALLPLACEWAASNEQQILATGTALSLAQIADARTMGVSHPEKVRFLIVPQVPTPAHPLLRAAAEATQLVSPMTAGMSLRYGIFIRSDCAGDRHLLAHELVHTAQYKRLGGFLGFLSQYLLECLTIGYPEAPMEQEAVAGAANLK